MNQRDRKKFWLGIGASISPGGWHLCLSRDHTVGSKSSFLADKGAWTYDDPHNEDEVKLEVLMDGWESLEITAAESKHLAPTVAIVCIGTTGCKRYKVMIGSLLFDSERAEHQYDWVHVSKYYDNRRAAVIEAIENLIGEKKP